MTRFSRYRATTLAGLMALGVLAGCSNSEPETPPTETPETSTAPTAETPATPVETTPAAVAEPTGLQPPDVVPEAAPAEPTPPDAQVLEDADATGMTARVRRDEPAPTPQETPAATDPSSSANDVQ